MSKFIVKNVFPLHGKGLIERLKKLQNRAARLIMNFKHEHGQSILARTSLGWTSLKERRAVTKAELMYKTINHLAPKRLCNMFQFCTREASHIDFVHEKRHMDVGGGKGLAPVTFLREKLWKISIVC